MTDQEKDIIIRWIIENVDASDVPSDESSDNGLIYNLVSLARHGRGYRSWNYEEDQQREVASWLSRSGGRP